MNYIFKVGDRVKLLANYQKEGTIIEHYGESSALGNPMEHFNVKFDDGNETRWWHKNDTILIHRPKNFMQNLKETFALILKAEPQKSFRKAGITNGDDLLTEEGANIFLTWLLSKNADAFKTEVVDPILAEEK